MLPSRFNPTQADITEVNARRLHGKSLPRAFVRYGVGRRSDPIGFDLHAFLQHKKVGTLPAPVYRKPRTPRFIKPSSSRLVVYIQVSEQASTLPGKGLTCYQYRYVLGNVDVLPVHRN